MATTPRRSAPSRPASAFSSIEEMDAALATWVPRHRAQARARARAGLLTQPLFSAFTPAEITASAAWRISPLR
ncbi:hypothetical protein AB0E04_49350 [Streptomyces sp. NPDC048251]|uniref:hypothetical protein n=1 Tax=Streptomyces sp. NPDC048251 TaxID=3154501 RepID=UPI0034381A17